MFWKRKEKPLCSENEFDLCAKAIYTEKYVYVPWKLDTYKDRIVLDFCRTCADDEVQVRHFTVELSLTGERLLPFEIEEDAFCWDTLDKALRRRIVPEGEGVALIPGVLIYPNDTMTMEKEFAEANYSEVALSYASFDGEKYMWCFADGSASPVVFETPGLFAVFIPREECTNLDVHMLSGDFISVINRLSVFAGSYVEAMCLNTDNAVGIYEKNLKKGKTEN